MTAVLIMLLTAALVIATKLFFDWTNKYGDEWNWAKIKEGYTKGWPKLLVLTVLILAATAIVYYLLPAPKSAFLAFYEMWNVWVTTWGLVGGFQGLRGLYKVWRETRRVSKMWIGFLAFCLLIFVGSAVWFCFEIVKLF
jgi:hypothetical protein